MSNIFATRVANQAVMVSGTDAEWLQNHLVGGALADANLQSRISAESPVMQDDYWPSSDSWMAAFKPYNVKNGTLFIPVKGMLIHDYGYQLLDWITGYTYIAKAFERGMSDPDVSRIAMVLSSGGGEVSGNFDLVDKIFSYRGKKPIQAFVNEAAYSAAYSLASVADTVSMTRTAGVGSIGVVMAHMDVSARMAENGIKVTFIHAGDHKVDGNPYTALPDDVKKRMQARIDSMYDIFVSTVARNRGIEEQAVRDTEALTFGAADALAVGLADEVLPFDEAVAAYSGALTNDSALAGHNSGEETMSLTQEDLDKARAEGMSQGKAEGATAERARISGILTSEAAVNKSGMAFHLALKTSQSVEEATGLLAVSAEEKPQVKEEAKGNHFEEAMKKNNPNIQASAEAGAYQDTEEEARASDRASFRAVNGLKKGA